MDCSVSLCAQPTFYALYCTKLTGMSICLKNFSLNSLVKYPIIPIFLLQFIKHILMKANGHLPMHTSLCIKSFIKCTYYKKYMHLNNCRRSFKWALHFPLTSFIFWKLQDQSNFLFLALQQFIHQKLFIVQDIQTRWRYFWQLELL